MKNLSIFFYSILFTLTINAQKLSGDQSKSTITYSMNHPLHAWTGVSNQINTALILDNNNNIKQIAAQVKVASFDSKNSNRDSHMIEVTEALKYPYITFTSTKIIENGNNIHIEGTLTFHNVKHNISFDATKKATDKNILLDGNFNVLMSQYNITNPSLMGIATDDLIKLNFKIFYKKQ